jgi:hypothetical protein
VHVGRAQRDVAKSGRLEGILKNGNAADQFAAALVLRLDADVMEPVIGEAPAAVACRAIGRRIEQNKAPFGILADGGLIPVDPAVEGCRSRNNCSFVIGDRLGDGIDGDRFSGIGARKGGPYPARDETASTARPASMFISACAWIGPLACSSSVSARPSQKCGPPQARFSIPGV